MASIFDGSFWDRFAGDIYNRTARVMLEIFLAGGKSGLLQLPERIAVLEDWDTFNQDALDFLKLYRLNTVPNISETARKIAVNLIGDWVQSGEPIGVLSKRLEPLWGARSKRIAVTEVTRTYAAGNISAWKNTGFVSYKVWQTAVDERVCPICGPLHGQPVSLDGEFALDQNELPPELAGSGNDFIYFAPPSHPNCRCYLKPVVSETKVSEKIREALNE